MVRGRCTFSEVNLKRVQRMRRTCDALEQGVH